jgi:hypothetical protein
MVGKGYIFTIYNSNKTNMRDDFSTSTKEVIAKRVSYRCSNPDCRKNTIGPNSNSAKSTSIGIAAHICAASKGGPRYDQNMTSEERMSINNGIWLCGSCATLIDKDESKYAIEVLKGWKERAEELAEKAITSCLTNVLSQKIIYDGYEFDTKLDATWAAFFKLIGWHYVYKPCEFKNWNPTFKIVTDSLEDSKYFVDVGLEKDFNKEKRQRLGEATNYSKNILLVFEDPFKQNRQNAYLNFIGFTSLEGITENNDFEFCVSIIHDYYKYYCVDGYCIQNMCEINLDDNDGLHDYLASNEEKFLPIWKEAKNIIGVMTSNNLSTILNF